MKHLVDRSKLQSLVSGSPQIKAGIMLVLTILYVVLFPPIVRTVGAGGTALIAIPVALAGWFFGVNIGLAASLFGIVLGTALLTIFEANNWALWIKTGWPGNLMTILIGLISGRLGETINEYKRAESELRSRERFLLLLKMVINSILNPQKAEDRYYYLITHIANLFIADYGYFFRWDENQQQAILIATTIPFDQPLHEIVLKPVRSTTVESIIRAENPLVIDRANLQDIPNLPTSNNLTSPSLFIIPIRERGSRLGVMVLAYDTPRRFTADEVNQAEQASSQIALAIWNTMQEIELQRNLREANAMSEIALALSETERIGLSNVLQLIVDSAKELIPNVEQAVIHLLDEKNQTLTYGAVIGFDDPAGGKKKMRVGEGIAGQVVISGETVNITDVKTDPRFLKLDNEPTYRSLMVTPVHSGGRKLGTISVSSNLPFAFNANDIKLLSQLGTQAAIAIENANLLESTQQALKESNALYRINQGLVTSLEPIELMKDTVELLQKNFGYHYVQIYVADPESGDFVMRAGSGRIGAQLKIRGHRIAAGEGIVGYTAATGSPFFTNNVDDIVSFTRNPLLPDTKSELAVPVKVGDTILGLLDIHQAPPGYLSHRDLQLVSAVADQLAIALQKADLYESLQASLQQEKAIRNQLMQNERLAVMGRLLATVSHELNNPLQAIQNALFLLKDETTFSPQGRQDLEIVLAESERMANMIERLRATYRPIQAEDFIPTRVNKLIEDVYALISTHLRHNQIVFEFQPDPELPIIQTLADQIRQVILNLMMNAVESMTTGGKLTVSTNLLQDTNEILIAISDTGKGIPADLLPNIFEAFVTNKQRGTGLGLTISYDIVMKHRGRITAENNPDQGALFKVWLPINNNEEK